MSPILVFTFTIYGELNQITFLFLFLEDFVSIFSSFKFFSKSQPFRAFLYEVFALLNLPSMMDNDERRFLQNTEPYITASK